MAAKSAPLRVTMTAAAMVASWRIHMVEQESAEERRKLKFRVMRYGLIVAIVAIILAVWGVASRIHSRSELRKSTTENAVLTVVTAKPQLSDAGNELVLPGIVQAYVESPI